MEMPGSVFWATLETNKKRKRETDPHREMDKDWEMYSVGGTFNSLSGAERGSLTV